MNLFIKNKSDELINEFTEKTENIICSLEERGSKEDISELKNFAERFKSKIKDFYNENRKLNIGVVGQVKAGKSSFLNTLLFDGQEILPKASTPKTATLTKMEYSDENIIEIEYYSDEDWYVIERNAEIDSDNEIYVSAREIVDMVKSRGIVPKDYTDRGTEKIKFDTYEELIAQLNDYVGEDGKVTPLVKAVTLYLNKEEFEGISIVDTPGLNDPIQSRTLRTHEFIEVCDVVFFLSQSGSFLDKSDWELLSSQLPQKGVKKLVLIASKYDSGVRDVLREKIEDDPFGGDDNTADNVKDACRIISKKLKKRARVKIEEFEKDLINRGFSQELIDVIKGCSKPILVSAMAWNMANKDVNEYNREEENVYKAISKFSDDVKDDLKTIGNIDEVRKVFDSVIEEKEKILEEKSKSMVPTAREELKEMLYRFKDKADKKIVMLSGNDREEILAQKQAMEYQINGIKAEIVTTFGEWETKLESEKVSTSGEIRSLSKEYNSIDERTGTRTNVIKYRVSDAKWYNPFTWKSSHTEYSTYQETYSYLAASDAVDNLRNFALESTNNIEEIFAEAVSHKEMKRKLLNVVTNNFDMGNEKYDASLFRIMVEDVVNKIEFPVIKIDASSAIDSITSSFSGEVTSNSEKNSLRTALSNAIDKFFDILISELDKNVRNFKKELDNIQNNIQKELLENINSEFDELVEKFENKEKEIENYKEYSSMLENARKSI